MFLQVASIYHVCNFFTAFHLPKRDTALKYTQQELVPSFLIYINGLNEVQVFSGLRVLGGYGQNNQQYDKEKH